MGGKSKGSAFEREVSKLLNVWLTGKTKPYVFWRSPSSGALATIHNENKDMSGDIIGISSDAKLICSILNFELKTGYKNTSIDKFLKYNKNDNLKDFWSQCINECNDKKYPILIYRKKGLSTVWICIDYFLYKLLKNKLKNYRYIKLHFKSIKDMYIFDMKEFLVSVKPEDIKEILNG